MAKQVTHFMYMPLTGLGLYGGHRGSRWLKNRIKIFKQFVLPSLINQTNKNFILWVSVREQDRKEVEPFKQFLEKTTPLNVVFTYSGVCFWDDKYEPKIARERLINALHGSMGELLNVIGESKEILMTIQPSDDVYSLDAVEDIQTFMKKNTKYNVYGYLHGYVMDYVNRRLSEWNPKTTPPFYTIRFSREVFTDPLKHLNYTGPYESHEYVKDFLNAKYVDKRNFLVGTHGENISTIFNHPFAGHEYLGDNRESLLQRFGLHVVPNLKLRLSLRKVIMRKLPYGWQRKLRYLLGERGYARVYNWLRS